jgi:predicted  nucleic acid-binding Zn-ribbon protein
MESKNGKPEEKDLKPIDMAQIVAMKTAEYQHALSKLDNDQTSLLGEIESKQMEIQGLELQLSQLEENRSRVLGALGAYNELLKAATPKEETK